MNEDFEEIEEENDVIRQAVDEYKKEEKPKLVNKEKEFVAEFDKEFIKDCRKEYVENKIQHQEEYLKFLLDWYKEYFNKDYPYFLRERPMNDALRVMGNIKKHKWELRWLTNPELVKQEITSDMIRKAKDFPIKELLSDVKGDFAKCPFHSEKTASFYLKGNFGHCFGCGITLDTIDLVMKLENIDFPSAVRKLQ